MMGNKEKEFEDFKRGLIDGNEREYGAEIRGRFGDLVVDEFNADLMGLSMEQHEEGERLQALLEAALRAAIEEHMPDAVLCVGQAG